MSGFKFAKSEDEFIPIPGEIQVKHKLDIIKEHPDYSLFFNYSIPDCDNSTNLKQIIEENILFSQFLEKH